MYWLKNICWTDFPPCSTLMLWTRQVRPPLDEGTPTMSQESSAADPVPVRARPGAGPPEADLTAAFVEAMGSLATAVTVVGSGHEGQRAGQTVSAMCSVSAEPPMVLVCVNRRSPVNPVIAASGRFTVNALATRHDHVADTFAGRPWPGKDRWDFTCGEWATTGDGLPHLADALAFFGCEVHSTVEAGTHLVHIGLVREVTTHDGPPLVYSGRAYAEPNPVSPSVFPDFPGAHPGNRISRTPGKEADA
jgi:flavin reductase